MVDKISHMAIEDNDSSVRSVSLMNCFTNTIRQQSLQSLVECSSHRSGLLHVQNTTLPYLFTLLSATSNSQSSQISAILQALSSLSIHPSIFQIVVKTLIDTLSNKFDGKLYGTLI